MPITITQAIRQHADSKRAKISQGFFKTGKGEYGEGDVFLGLTVPQCRKIAKDFSEISLVKVRELLTSKIHEERLVALLILVHNYDRSENKAEIFNFYTRHINYVNNWDLVDLSAPNIFGRHILQNGEADSALGNLLFEFARSENLWKRRVAIVGTYYFIKNNRFEETLAITELLMEDNHDLIHKACGWMLREIGKRNVSVLEEFLAKHYKTMPRTMLRYSIERFPEKTRKSYLRGEI